MPPLSLDSHVSKDNSQVIDRIVDGEALLIDLQTGNYFSLNAVGTRIWESLDGTRTVQDIIHIVSDEYNVDVQRAEADVLTLVNDLISEGLAVVN